MKENDKFNRRRRRTTPVPQSDTESNIDYENGLNNDENEKIQRYISNGSNGKQKNRGYWHYMLEKKKRVTRKLPKLSKTQLRLLVAAKICLYIVQFLILHWLFSKWFPKKFVGRSETDAKLNEIPLKLAIFDYPTDNSIGGWKWRYTQRFFQPPPFTEKSKRNQTIPDFGGLYIFRPKLPTNDRDRPLIGGSTARLAPQRQIQPNHDQSAEEYWEFLNTESYTRIREREEWPEDIEDQKLECRHPSWARKPKPSCNTFHELYLLNRKDKHYAGHGDFRDVWLLDHFPLSGDPNNDELYQTALKMNRFWCDWDRADYWGILGDANAMEALSMSRRIVDIYGHCGTSVWVEPMPVDIVESIVYDEGDGMMKQEELKDEKELKPQNKETVEEKMEMALAFAESMADLHGSPHGVIVHDDIQLAQFLKTKNGTIKFGDFNRMVALPYNSETGKYCKYKFGSRPWRYRSPEEYESYHLKNESSLGWMNEQIDTYSYGNTIYALLTGLWPFYSTKDDDLVSHQVINGTRPYVDPRWRTQGFLESKLVEVMEQCWIQDPDKRISIFEVVRQLRDVKKEYYEKHKIIETPK